MKRGALALATTALTLLGAAASPTGARQVVLAASNTVAVLDGVSLERLGTVPVGRWVSEFAATRDGKEVFLGTSGGVYGLKTAGLALAGPYTTRPVESIELSPDGQRLLVLDYEVRQGGDGEAERIPSNFRASALDVITHEVTPVAAYESEVYDIAVARVDAPLVTLDFRAGQLLQPQNGVMTTACSLTPGGTKERGMFLRLTADTKRGRLLLPQIGDPGVIWVWDESARAASSWPLPKPALPVRGSTLSPDGSRYYLLALQSLHALDASNGTELQARSLDGGGWQQVAMSPDGAALYITCPVQEKGGRVLRLSSSDLSTTASATLEDISPYAVISVQTEP